MRIIGCAIIFAATACGGPNQQADSGTDACPPGVSVVDAWTKPARAGQPVSAAYLTICNGGDVPDALIAVSGVGDRVASSLETHLSEMSDGVMSMKQVERVDLPAGARTTFEPGGAHIMLIGIAQEIAAGAEPTFKLEFENAEPIHWAFEVRTEHGADEDADSDDGHDHH